MITRVKENAKEQVADLGLVSGGIDQIFALKHLVEKYREKRKELYVAFMDLEKPYDKVCREELWRVLHECKVDGYLIWRMNSLYWGSNACVRPGS